MSVEALGCGVWWPVSTHCDGLTFFVSAILVMESELALQGRVADAQEQELQLQDLRRVNLRFILVHCVL